MKAVSIMNVKSVRVDYPCCKSSESGQLPHLVNLVAAASGREIECREFSEQKVLVFQL